MKEEVWELAFACAVQSANVYINNVNEESRKDCKYMQRNFIVEVIITQYQSHISIFRSRAFRIHSSINGQLLKV